MPSALEKACRKALGQKIGINLAEFKSRARFVSRKQAIAVAYSQVKQASPKCAKYFTRKSVKRKSPPRKKIASRARGRKVSRRVR